MENNARKIKLGISVGDPNGIGIEVILKAFQDKRMFGAISDTFWSASSCWSQQRKHLNLETPIALIPLDKNRVPAN